MLPGPDLERGVPLQDIPASGMLRGHALGMPVLLVRRDDAVHAIGAECTHYHAPLADGLVAGNTVRCPWHHACFDLRTGEAVRAPALNPLPRFAVEVRNGRAYVTREITGPPPRRRPARSPASVIIVGAGAAGDAAADMLRREGYDGAITMIGQDADAPYDRPNVSKDFLAGNAPADWMPLRAQDYYAQRDITLVTGRAVDEIDLAGKRVTAGGDTRAFDALLLATGAEPIRLPKSLDPDGRVLYLRTLADSRAIIERLASGGRAVVIGASFIGLEVAASLRARGLEVSVVAPESHPLERVLGRALSDLVRRTHEAHGVTFHLGRSVSRVHSDGVVLDDGSELPAGLVVAGIGVRPAEHLAADAGLAVNNGIVVDAHLETSARSVFAAGDVARYPDPHTGRPIRVEHWVAAQRQGQAAARNILGAGERFRDVPFFWSVHHDLQINYVGHAERWDEIVVEGSVEARDCAVRYVAGGKTLAAATVGRDRDSLLEELALEGSAGGAPLVAG